MKTMTEAQWSATHSDFAQIWTTERTDWADWDQLRDKYIGKRTIMHDGSLLVEGMGLTITPNPPVHEKKPVFLRDIGYALEKTMNAQPDTSLHWVAVVGEDSVQRVPTKLWHFNEEMIQVGVVQGNSEGSLIYVHAQNNRYAPDQVTVLFRIKLLCSAKHAFKEAKVVYEFFESKEFADMTGQS